MSNSACTSTFTFHLDTAQFTWSLQLTNNSLEMETKRPLSPSAFDANNEVVKRVRVANSSLEPYRGCIHCGSALHLWVQCTRECTHCRSTHCGKRCLRLDVAAYCPGGFRLRATSSSSGVSVSNAPPQTSSFGPKLGGATSLGAPPYNGISVTQPLPPTQPAVQLPVNPQRAAMIQARPSINRGSGGPTTTQTVTGGGPQRTGSNSMPLGKKKPIGTSWSSTAPPPPTQAVSRFPQPAAGPSGLGPLAADPHEQQKRTWKALKKQIRSAASVPTKYKLRDRSSRDVATNKQIIQVFNILRPMVMGNGAFPHSEDESEYGMG